MLVWFVFFISLSKLKKCVMFFLQFSIPAIGYMNFLWTLFPYSFLFISSRKKKTRTIFFYPNIDFCNGSSYSLWTKHLLFHCFIFIVIFENFSIYDIGWSYSDPSEILYIFSLDPTNKKKWIQIRVLKVLGSGSTTLLINAFFLLMQWSVDVHLDDGGKSHPDPTNFRKWIRIRVLKILGSGSTTLLINAFFLLKQWSVDVQLYDGRKPQPDLQAAKPTKIVQW